ncbi:MAG TPA: hypothetical protein VN716_17445 [Vicinamibacterales bacterium]|nr:hypothetical protein [Vicinamibacterales bacterium]
MKSLLIRRAHRRIPGEASWHRACSGGAHTLRFREGGRMAIIGRKVAFAVKDVYFPAPTAVLGQLHGNEVISGQIVGVSDSGRHHEAFAVVRVDGLEAPVVIAIERIRPS